MKKWRWGFRSDFYLWIGREYYDGPVYAVNLGWVWINYKPWGWK
jgi:hypothetical protein